MVYTKKNPEYGTLMLYRKYAYHYIVKPIEFIPLRKLPRDVQMMAVRIEDANFYEHFGIDLTAIHDAYVRNRQNHGYSYGASTINQQLARTLFLIPSKNILRKYLEIIIAVEMNFIMKKGRILELYLNSIEWGKGIFGIERASRYYYSKNVGDLNDDEKARLIAILSSPIKYNPDNLFKRKILSQRYYFLMAIMNSTDQNSPLLSQTNDFTIITNTNDTDSSNIVNHIPQLESETYPSYLSETNEECISNSDIDTSEE